MGNSQNKQNYKMETSSEELDLSKSDDFDEVLASDSLDFGPEVELNVDSEDVLDEQF